LTDGAFVHLTNLGLSRNAVDAIYRFTHRLPILGRHIDRTIVLDINLDSGLFDDRADHFSTRADDLADLLGPHFKSDDAWRVLCPFRAWRSQRLRHLLQNMQPPFPSLIQGLLHNLPGHSEDLNVHL